MTWFYLWTKMVTLISKSVDLAWNLGESSCSKLPNQDLISLRCSFSGFFTNERSSVQKTHGIKSGPKRLDDINRSHTREKGYPCQGRTVPPWPHHQSLPVAAEYMMKPGCNDCFPRGCHPLWQQRLQRGCSSTLYSLAFLSTSGKRHGLVPKVWQLRNLRFAQAAWTLLLYYFHVSFKVAATTWTFIIDLITDETPSFAATIGRVPDTDDYLHLQKMSAVLCGACLPEKYNAVRLGRES